MAIAWKISINTRMVVGDFNVRIGADDARYNFHETTNSNGKYLLELTFEKNFIILNTYFQKRKGKLWTFISPGGTNSTKTGLYSCKEKMEE